MLELLLIAFLSNKSNDTLSQHKVVDLPQIEILEPSKIPSKDTVKLSPKLLEDPQLSILAKDLNSNKTLFEKKSSHSQNIASLTKLMTFLLIYENHSLDEIVTIDPQATKIYGAQIELYAYEKMSVRTLLEAILIPSANDGAVALAIFNAGSEDLFAEKMNKKAEELGLTSAKFYNATGLDMIQDCGVNDKTCDSQFYGNQMSAEDLMMLTRILLKNDFFKQTVRKKNFEGTSSDGKFFHEKESTNKLFDTFIGSKGIKTGYTDLAGQCFINLSENKAGDEIITIILGSSDRFGETVNLMSWILDSYEWR